MTAIVRDDDLPIVAEVWKELAFTWTDDAITIEAPGGEIKQQLRRPIEHDELAKTLIHMSMAANPPKPV